MLKVDDNPGSTCRRSKVEEQGEGEVRCKCLVERMVEREPW